MNRSLSFLVLAGLTLAAPGAHAQEETPGFVRTVVPRRAWCLLWNTREYLFRVDAAGSLRTPGTTESAAIDASFDAWRALSRTCSDFAFTRGPDIQNPWVGYDRESDDNENVLTFREVACEDAAPPEDACWVDDTCASTYACWDHGSATIALTTSTFTLSAGHVLDADIELNASERSGAGFLFTTVDSPPCDGPPSTHCVSTDLQNTLTHEIGHVVGLDHVANPGSTMEPTAPPGETHKRSLDEGTAAGFCGIYPRNLPPVQCGEPANISRTFQAVNRGSGLGCGAGAGSLLAPAALLGVLALLRRRQGAGRQGLPPELGKNA